VGASSTKPAARAEWLAKPERGSRVLLRLMSAFSLRCGRRASRILLHAATVYFFLFAPRARRASGRYLRLALGRKPRLHERYRHLAYFATTIHDRVFLAGGRADAFDLSVEGGELLREQHAAGRGAILLGAHLGSFEMVGALGRRIGGVPMSMAMYEENARKLRDLLVAIAADVEPDVVPLGRIDSMLRIAERVDAGAFVGMLGDRTIGREALHAATVLGGTVHLPTGPMRLAAALGSRVIFMAGLYRGANRYHIVFAEVADFAGLHGAARTAAIPVAIERYAQLIERQCRSDPYNWFNFYEFWQMPGGADGG